ncbi:NAD(P)H-dependent glycerol-3-phosphate dehydrogenase [Bacillota bacterium LX-D]|nr:NAD(P)H-dependent glycerol-3-phosphate dehydrogenase [Bacillota bacterium LX-D]
MKNICVLGAGSWGTALAVHLAKKGLLVRLWSIDKEQVDIMNETRFNQHFLPDIELANNIEPTCDLDFALHGAKLVVLSVPSNAVREVVQLFSPKINKDVVIVNTAKGLEEKTLMRMSQVIMEETKGLPPVAVLSGPSHAEEVSRFLPTAVVAAAKQRKVAEFVQDIFMAVNFRVYTNPDICGVEIGGALKNVIALATGIADGLGFGDNTRAALMTRGITEISRVGIRLKADPLTFAGLTGIGDLIVTCSSMHSRNRRAGIQLGQGIPLDTILKNMGMVVEGANTVKAAVKLARQLCVEMPITQEVHDVLYKGKKPIESVNNLMKRNRTHEVEEVVTNCNFI